MRDRQGHAATRPRNRESFAERRERRGAVEDPEVVLEAAARFLEARPRSIAEVRRRLGGAGYPPELIDGAVARLVELGMLDDAEFARLWVESRDRARPRGERALRQELAVKGIDRGVVDALLDERSEQDGAADRDAAAAARLLERQQRALSRESDPRRRRQKAYAVLARNGFDSETCGAAVRRWELAIGAANDADSDSDADGLP
ncbi:MAG: regulatory protein RecX [Chloroflexota bacterium]